MERLAHSATMDHILSVNKSLMGSREVACPGEDATFLCSYKK